MQETTKSVYEFIKSIDHPKKQKDAFRLLEIFEEITGYPAVMWGPSIVGFGKVHYQYASKREGDMPLVGFSFSKAHLTLYLLFESDKRERLLENFGKYRKSKACLYVNKLEDIDVDVLKTLIRASLS